MIVALDVGYGESEAGTVGLCGIVAFEQWVSESALVEDSVMVEGVAAYVPGRFFERELPCLLRGLEYLGIGHDAGIDVVVIDGHVRLDQAGAPGLGAYLFDALGASTPVVGVAKRPFNGLEAVEVARGTSLNPLFVTAAGMDEDTAASLVESMAGPFRIPTMLKRADALSRGIS